MNALYEAIALFLDAWDEIRAKEHERNGYHWPSDTSLGLEHGKKYLRVVQVVYDDETPGLGVKIDGIDHKRKSIGVEAFIDESTGDIYYPAGWAKPAKHVRGNVFSPKHGAEAIGPGGWGIRTLK